ncbi:acyl-CoA dehydrogenase family protein [Paraburkholderia sp. IW21]|uniref:acyl-CoA dehydrogenase family protein n=1 Tax=Paraburkholderia sp. IW21 TaxID=3242488 RepID=UPI0035227FB5
MNPTSVTLETLRQRTRAFINDEVIPREDASLAHDFVAQNRVIHALRQQAREAGVIGPGIPRELGGLGLSFRDRAVILEESGRSVLGPHALQAGPPDETNILMLDRLCTGTQRTRYLEPLAAGSATSCFAMTEPPPGAGSDPAMLQTRAVRRNGKWVIDGRKWFISGALGADFAIVMAQTESGPTMFIVDTDTPGYRTVRVIDALDGFISSHCELSFESCTVGDDAVLGQVGDGFAHAQLRLEPARLTHCMRFIGAARRALEIAERYVSGRESFGKPLGQHQNVQTLIADSHIDLYASRTMTFDVATRMDAGVSVKHESSMAKVFVSEAVGRVVDRAVQMTGAFGISGDSMLSVLYREVRPFRIFDGASEVHRSAIAQRVLKQYAQSPASSSGVFNIAKP